MTKVAAPFPAPAGWTWIFVAEFRHWRSGKIITYHDDEVQKVRDLLSHSVEFNYQRKGCSITREELEKEVDRLMAGLTLPRKRKFRPQNE